MMATVTIGKCWTGLSSRMGITGSVCPPPASSCQFSQAEQVAEARVDLDLTAEVGREEGPPSVHQLDQVVARDTDPDLVLVRHALVERAHRAVGEFGPIGHAEVGHGDPDDPGFRQGARQRAAHSAAGFLQALDQLSKLPLDLTLRRHDAPSSSRIAGCWRRGTAGGADYTRRSEEARGYPCFDARGHAHLRT